MTNATSASSPGNRYMIRMNTSTARMPSKPARRPAATESWPKLAPIVRMSITLSGTGSAPYRIWIANESASS